MMMNEKTNPNLKLVALTLIPGFGPATLKKLLERFETIERIFEASKKDFRQFGRLPKNFFELLQSKDLIQQAEKEVSFAASQGVQIISFFDQKYPAPLKEIANPPILLYVKGVLPTDWNRSVAVVGSRVPTLYGQKMAQSISKDLANNGVIIVSGMALGIDTAAHEGALETKGQTIAVLGSGLSNIYPSQNKKLSLQISESGAVISEFPMKMSPLKQNFPMRNRIVSGLSKAVLVVEAKEKSGAFITVEYALEQGRDVYAMPGNADSPKSRGTNLLLKQGARPVTEAQDILEDFGIKNSHHQSKTHASLVEVKRDLTEDEGVIFSLINNETVSIEKLLEKTELALPRVTSALLTLQLKRCVKELPGKNFVKV